ncbi:unnamed protein product [Lactuca virosa]|uniref:Uncharacterized protein n=1 Tax=Lactuca virosa TaxID=75947 RepID=A0AAU9NAJ7_9ASTR|nr:unnamed protein product [Lactuca virosa]
MLYFEATTSIPFLSSFTDLHVVALLVQYSFFRFSLVPLSFFFFALPCSSFLSLFLTSIFSKILLPCAPPPPSTAYKLNDFSSPVENIYQHKDDLGMSIDMFAAQFQLLKHFFSWEQFILLEDFISCEQLINSAGTNVITGRHLVVFLALIVCVFLLVAYYIYQNELVILDQKKAKE